MDTFDMLKTLCDARGVSGSETAVRSAAASLLAPLGPVEVTPLGSLLCHVVPAADNGPRVLLDAHLDEVGFVVTAIDDAGFVKVAPVGGIDKRLLPASQVVISGSQPVFGVIGCLPPHLSGMKGYEEIPDIDKLYIDTGYDREALQELVSLGDRASYRTELQQLLGSRVSGKSLDDRAGCVVQLLAAAQIKAATPAGVGVDLLLSSLEETGEQGAKTGAFGADYTHAVAVDVSFGMSPGCDADKCGELGKGPMIGYSPILDRDMYCTFCALAQKQGIPYQPEIMGGLTASNADAIAVSRAGVRTLLVSVPQRYMHTPVEVVDLQDIEHTAALIAAYVSQLAQ